MSASTRAAPYIISGAPSSARDAKPSQTRLSPDISSAFRPGPEALDQRSASYSHRSGNPGQRCRRVGHGPPRTVLLLLHVLDLRVTHIVLGGLAAALSLREAHFLRW